MAVSTGIPNTTRVPLFYARMDNSQANLYQGNFVTLLIGQKLSAGTAPANVPVIVGSQLQANTLFGRGSMLARMYAAYLRSNPAGEIWCLPVDENSSGTAQKGIITVTGSATAAGTINQYIAGQLVQVGVSASDTDTVIAAAIAAAINAQADLPITATSASGVVTWTCKWKGETGGDIQVGDSYQGLAGGESLPAGISLAYAYTTAGTSNPSLTAAITGMGDEVYDFIIHPFTDTTSLAAIAGELNDTSGRWSYLRQIYGHAYTAERGALSALTTFGATHNDQHNTVAAMEADVQAPSWEYAAAYGAANAVGISDDPACPTQTLPLVGILAPRAGKRFLWSERNALLHYGIATSYVDRGGVVRVERAITTYQTNTLGAADVSYLDSETLHQSAYILRYLKTAVTSKYGRYKLADDGTTYGAGQAIVTPRVIRGKLIAAYNDLIIIGMVENMAAYQANLIVERDPLDTDRINVLFPPDYINQLRVFALLNQFRLQYPAA